MKKPPEWLLGAFEATPVRSRECARNEEARRRLEAPFDELRNTLLALRFPTTTTPRVRAMIGRAWKLIVTEQLRVVLAFSTLEDDEPLADLCFGAAKDIESGVAFGRLFLPLDWVARVAREPVGEAGVVVYTLAQAVSFCEGGDVGAPMFAIGEAYHADFLLHVMARFPRYQLTPKEREHVERWPLGLDTPGAVTLGDPPPSA